jgi:hypothetical protein
MRMSVAGHVERFGSWRYLAAINKLYQSEN